MSILGVVVRVKPGHLTEVLPELSAMDGLEIALNPGDGRLVVILEDTPATSAAQNMASIALMPAVLNTSLVYEYSGPDVDHTPAPAESEIRYQSWRNSLTELAANPHAHSGAPAAS